MFDLDEYLKQRRAALRASMGLFEEHDPVQPEPPLPPKLTPLEKEMGRWYLGFEGPPDVEVVNQ